MSKRIAIFLSVILMICPSVSRADRDVLAVVQDKIAEYQERLDVITRYYTGFSVDLMKLATDRGALLNDLRQQAKAVAMQQLMLVADNVRVGMMSVPGLSDQVTAGIYMTPGLRNTLAGQFLQRRAKKIDQFSDATAEVIKNNNLAIENLGMLFAKAIVRRGQLAEEGNEETQDKSKKQDDEQIEAKDATTLTQKYMEISRRANARWIDVMSYISAQEEIMSTIEMAHHKVDNLSDITGNLQDNELNSMNMAAMRSNGASLLSLYLRGRDTYNRVKAGDYAGALGNVAGTFVDISGQDNDVLRSVVTGAYATQNAYYDLEDGNWSAALAEMGSGAGAIVGNTVDMDLGYAIHSGGNLVDSVNHMVNGDPYAAHVVIDDAADMLVGMQGYNETRAEKADQKKHEQSSDNGK